VLHGGAVYLHQEVFGQVVQKLPGGLGEEGVCGEAVSLEEPLDFWPMG
jgi:hypothetical protein